MDPEQRLILDAIFAESSPGVPAAFEVGVIAPRQNLKTATLQIAALTDVFVLGERLHMWTAHLFPTAVAAFEGMVQLVESNDDFRKRCRKPRTANGDEAIELLTGERIKFHARSKGGGRGFTGDKITFDEALFLQRPEVGALYPTLATRPGAQIRYGSSAGLATSDVLRAVRDRGRKGDDPRLAWLEWAAPPAFCAEPTCSHQAGEVQGCVLDRMDLLLEANPAMSGPAPRISMETMLAFRRSMPPEEFMREFLGWWDEPAAQVPVFGPGQWEACASVDRPRSPVGALAVAVSVDLQHAAIAAAARDDDIVFVKPLQHGPGTGWLVDRVKALQQQHRIDVVVDGRGPAADLVPVLERAGIRLKIAETRDVLDACAGLFAAVRERRVRHESYPELDRAVSGAKKRDVGDRWAWGRKASSADISPLEAVTLAAWATSRKRSSLYETRGMEVVG